MIQITLNFVSVEAARQALLDIPSNVLVGETAAAAPVAAPAPKPQKVAATQPAAATPAAKVAPAVESPSAPKPAAEVSAPAPVAASPASSSEPSPSVDYPTLQKAVFALAGKNRELVVAVAGSFGVKTFKELAEDKWPAAFTAINEKLAELEAA